ncbi:MAG: hypothetical protein H6500_05730 [Candidatus Woesearchaeota archaeon]|nr:MAG: hypothetical protein H6500_05730 [Candidatus Woesearchaeota archaeon]
MKKTKAPEKHQFHDINKFPAETGLLLFGISMSKISNSQSAKKCFEYIEHLVCKIEKPHVGLNFIYSDYLYFNSDEQALALKNKFQALMIAHKNEFQKILNKHKWYVQSAVAFMTWGQFILEAKEFPAYLGKLKKLYETDELFRQYLKKDAIDCGVELTENQKLFFLEEILLIYLVAKGRIALHNDFVQGKEKWKLFCYPGKTLYSEIYLFQINPFKLSNPENKYENSYYDLEEKKIYDFLNIDLKTFTT